MVRERGEIITFRNKEIGGYQKRLAKDGGKWESWRSVADGIGAIKRVRIGVFETKAQAQQSILTENRANYGWLGKIEGDRVSYGSST